MKNLRKYQQNQIIELLITLNEAFGEIRSLLTMKKPSELQQLLADTQEFLVQVGNYIKSVAGAGTKTVALLEEYQEALGQVYAALDGVDFDDGYIIRLRKLLAAIENSVRTELKPDKFEIAFLPYKASMFDAFESVWRAAEDDPVCEAYVIPIPYYDKNSDGSLGKRNYEGDEYPEYVPAVDYQTYDLETRRPDVIFIHNPFDNNNLVTSVHPNYYCEKLKDFTELLCYIPYYVVDDDVPDYSCFDAATIFCDRIFWQSEKVRRTCVRIFKKFEKTSQRVGRYGKPENRFMSSGSPKFDKAINSSADDFTLHEKWRKLLEKPDGTLKKAVLYNTTINAILQGNEQYIEKLRYVFDTFQKREDVVLWWRPHPLSGATYRSMRPELIAEYEKIAADYCREGWGIFDDTPDLHRAICFTSMLYGDGGSMLPLYQCHEKPIMIQNVDIHGQEDALLDKLPLAFILDSGDALWSATLNFNVLLKIDKQTWKAEYVGSFPGEDAYSLRHFGNAAEHEQLLFFAPLAAKKIAVYDRKNGVFQNIEIPSIKQNVKFKVKYNEQRKFTKVIKAGGQLFFIPSTYPGILIYDLSSRRIKVVDDWLEHINRLIINYKSSNFGTSYFNNEFINKEQNCLILACTSANVLVKLDMNTHETVIYELNNSKIGYFDVVLSGNDYWLLSLNKPLICRWNPNSNEYKEYEIKPEGISYDDETCLFQKLIYIDGSLFLIPWLYGKIVEFNISSKVFSFLDNLETEEQVKTSDSPIGEPIYSFFRAKSNNRIYLFTVNNYLVEIDPVTGSTRKERIQIKDRKSRLKLQQFLLDNKDKKIREVNDCVFYEDLDLITLETLLDALAEPVPPIWLLNQIEKQPELRKKKISHPDGKSGLEIYNICKKAVLG